MIKLTHGNILKDNSQSLVNPVNCVGIMGAGLALQFKKQYPNNFKEYKLACNLNKVQLGKMFITRFDDNRYIINFPTKYHWKENSKIEYINNGLCDLLFQSNYLNIKSIAIPKIGCGLGGLDWNIVKRNIIDIFHDKDFIINIYE